MRNGYQSDVKISSNINAFALINVNMKRLHLSFFEENDKSQTGEMVASKRLVVHYYADPPTDIICLK